MFESTQQLVFEQTREIKNAWLSELKQETTKT